MAGRKRSGPLYPCSHRLFVKNLLDASSVREQNIPRSDA
jgi:hypothetical protein